VVPEGELASPEGLDVDPETLSTIGDAGENDASPAPAALNIPTQAQQGIYTSAFSSTIKVQFFSAFFPINHGWLSISIILDDHIKYHYFLAAEFPSRAPFLADFSSLTVHQA